MTTQITVREKLVTLHQAVAHAEQARAEYVTQLREEGFSLRQIATVLGISPSTVMRWGPVQTTERTFDDPA